MKVSAYRNLNKPGVMFSIRAKGKVIDWQKTVVLHNASFKHPNSNALKRIRAGNREVCAWVNGTLGEPLDASVDGLRRVACDPKKLDTFQDAITGETLTDVSLVVLCKEGCFYR